MNRAERRALAKQIAKGGVPIQEQPPEPKVITLGYCYSELNGVAGAWHSSILKLYAAGARAGYAFRECPVETGPFLSSARNMILSRSLEYEDDYLLMTDTDTVFQPQDVSLLLEADAAIAGAHYLTAAAGEPPRAVALVEVDSEAAVGEKTYEPVDLPELPTPPYAEEFEDTKDYEPAVMAYMAELAEPEYAPRKVAAVGCGLMLIRRDVMVAMAEEFDNPFEYVGNVGEDVTFCLRAAHLGFDTVLVPQARIGHLKMVVL